MMNKLTAEEYLQEGNLDEAMQQLKEQVRKDPANVQQRIFLFQLLCIQGDWQRALTQLNVAGELDDSTLAMVSMYRQVIACERFREQVFMGNKEPLVMDRPEEWVAWLIQALKLTGQEKYQESQQLRERAFDAAPAISGTIDAQPFAWIADSDVRLGPMQEAIIDGRYFWVPVQCIQSMTIEKPVDLRDLVWLPVHYAWRNGGESYGLIPTRYPASYQRDDPLLALSRKTIWEDCGADLYIGYGQKVLTTESLEYPVMDIREIKFDAIADLEKELSGG
jgi:type VI secretion system protein ImpE